jgi:hypothetical protein
LKIFNVLRYCLLVDCITFFVNKKSMPRFVSCCIAVSLLLGCTRGADPQDAVAKANATNLQRLSNLYLAYQGDNNWQGPADEAKFKEFIRGFSPKKLTRIGIDPNATDSLFVSERDGQPFKIRYSVAGNMMGSMEPVIFEAEGIDGKRLVGFLDMSQREVDNAEYESLFANGASSQSPAR